MEIKDFVKSILVQLNEAVDEVHESTNREIRFTNTEGKRTVEFDIAVSAEDASSASGKAGIKVLSVLEGGGDVSKSNRNSLVSRVQFGLSIHSMTKAEQVRSNEELRARNSKGQIGYF